MITVPNKIKQLMKTKTNLRAILLFWLIYNDGKKSYEEILEDMIDDVSAELALTNSDKISNIRYCLIVLEQDLNLIIHTIENNIDYYTVDYGIL